MRISDWSSDVCSSDLAHGVQQPEAQARPGRKPYLMLGHSYYIDVNSVGTRFLLGKPTWAKFEDQRPFLASAWVRSEEHTSELQSLMRSSYAVFCLKKKKLNDRDDHDNTARIHSNQSRKPTRKRQNTRI